jgi:hypothetical protein
LDYTRKATDTTNSTNWWDVSGLSFAADTPFIEQIIMLIEALIREHRLFVIPLEDGSWMVGLPGAHDSDQPYLDAHGVIDGHLDTFVVNSNLEAAVVEFVSMITPVKLSSV